MTQEAASVPHLPPGTLIAGRYQLDGAIAEGGMGVVYAAHHADLGQDVAIKLLRPEILAHAEVVTRFLHEARISARLHSEHAARVFDVGTLADGVPFMVMERLRGDDLEGVLQARGPLPVEEVAGYAIEALEAIAEAHANGIIHRDLKPANLFLAARPDGSARIKVLDFGISKAIGPSATPGAHAITATQNLVGSPAYMAPEQVRSPKSIDHRVDIWAMGLVLHELLTCHRPLIAETAGEVLVNVLEKKIPKVRSLRADLPAGIERVIDRCLQRDPAERYPDAAALARDLAPFASPAAKAIADRMSGRGSVPSFTTDDSVPAATATTLAVQARPRVSLGAGIAVAIGALVLGAVVVLIVILSRGSGGPSAQASAATPEAAPSSAGTAPVPMVAPSTPITATAALTASSSALPASSSKPSAPSTAAPGPKKKGTPSVDVLQDRQ